jgi:hypothetical protein
LKPVISVFKRPLIHMFVLQLVRCERAHQFARYRIPAEWNSLPANIREHYLYIVLNDYWLNGYCRMFQHLVVVVVWCFYLLFLWLLINIFDF